MSEWISAIYEGPSFYYVSLIGVVVIILVGFLYTHKKTRRTEHQPQRTTNIYEIYRAISENRLYAFLEKIDRERHGDKAKAEEQRLINITNLLMWWTAALASATLLAAFFAGWTLPAIRGQLEEMIADKRPWVKWTTITPIGSLERQGDSLKVHISYRLRAIGKNPAINASFWPKLIIEPFVVTRKDFGDTARGLKAPSPEKQPDIIREARENCDAGAKGTWIEVREPMGKFQLAWGQTVFPDETTEEINFDVSTSSNEFKIRGIRQDDDITIRLLACVTYADSVTKRVYETAVNYRVHQTAQNGKPGAFVINMASLPLTVNEWTLMVDTLNAGFTAEYQNH